MPVWLLMAVFLISLFGTWFTLLEIIPLLKRAGITGKDLHKPGQPEVPEMGGLGILVGLSGGLVLSVGAEAFLGIGTEVKTLLAILSTILIVAFIGVFDDLLKIPQIYKTVSPIFAALPLIAIRAGDTSLLIPFIGNVDFWIFYPLFLVPLGVTGAANAVNMLAGFNGMEAGVGFVALSSLAIIACLTGSWVGFLLLLAGLASLIPVIFFDWCSASVLVGDVGTLAIGAIAVFFCVLNNCFSR